MNAKKTLKIPIFLHNLKGYDAHLIMKEMDTMGKIDVIPTTPEKYISFTLDNKVCFKDTFNFLSASLEKLVNNLNDEDFKHTSHFWKDENKINLMKQKGVFPYDWFNSVDKFNYDQLPSIDDFDNLLCGSYDIYEEENKNIDDCKPTHILQEDYDKSCFWLYK